MEKQQQKEESQVISTEFNEPLEGSIFKKEGVIRCEVLLIMYLFDYCLLLPLGFKLHEGGD